MGRGRMALGLAATMRIAAVFPGQGSQCRRHGRRRRGEARPPRANFSTAPPSILGYDLLALQCEGPDEKLRETEFSQPAIFTTNLALYAAAGETLEPVVTAGHSFAELCSLVVARSLTFDDALAHRKCAWKGDAGCGPADSRQHVGDLRP